MFAVMVDGSFIVVFKKREKGRERVISVKLQREVISKESLKKTTTLCSRSLSAIYASF